MSKCVHGPNFMPINPEAIVQCTRCGEFTKRKDKSIEKYNTLLEEVINKALGDYNIETIEILDILNDFVYDCVKWSIY